MGLFESSVIYMKIPNYSEIALQLGKRGGMKTALKGSDYYRTIGKKGAAKRWKKKEPTPNTNGKD